MGKREYGDYFPVIDTTPVEDKGKVLDELRGMVANMENNVLISPVMGADGNFADACSACWGKGTVAGCAECGVILDGDQDENNLPRCSHVEYCEDGESYGCSREFGHKGKCVRGRRVEV
jgi:RecJ-like exonuclease